MTWSQLVSVLPPFFLGTLISAAFGTFFGAWVASRSQTKKSVVTELNNISAAITLCFAIANKYLSLKRQHMQSLKVEYDKAQSEFSDFKSLRAANRGDKLFFSLSADLKTIDQLNAPIDVLANRVFDSISIRGRGLVAVVELLNSEGLLKVAMETRRELVKEFQVSKYSPEQMAFKYLGHADDSGVLDERIKNNIEGLTLYTDDCIFFAMILEKDLRAHGNKLIRRYSWRFRVGDAKRLPEGDWSGARDLIPPEAQYEKWLIGFKGRADVWYRAGAWTRKKWETAKTLVKRKPESPPKISWVSPAQERHLKRRFRKRVKRVIGTIILVAVSAGLSALFFEQHRVMNIAVLVSVASIIAITWQWAMWRVGAWD